MGGSVGAGIGGKIAATDTGCVLGANIPVIDGAVSFYWGEEEEGTTYD